MLKHNILLFLRNINKNKGTFLINTIGLGIGIASFLVLALYVYNDLTYNHFHENLSNIYRVREGEGFQTKGTLLPKLLNDIPEVENGTRIFDWDGARLSYGEVAFFENINYVDTGFFEMFSFPFVEGEKNGGVHQKFDVVVSTKFAKKYFGDEPALGKQLQVRFEDIFLTIKGVVDIPKNSSIQFDIVASYETGETVLPWIKDVHDWYNTFSVTYVQLSPGADPETIDGKLQTIVTENFLPVGTNKTDLNLLPFSEYHGVEESNRTLIVILALVAMGILGIAIVNFVNLTITDALTRTREIGIKKVYGATTSHLFGQIITESFLVGLVALVLGMLLTVLLLPTFNSLFETALQFNPLKNTFVIYVLLSVWVFIGLVSGVVPSFLWARTKVIESLQGKLSGRSRSGFSKYSSIIVQFVIAIGLISGTFLIRKQIDYMMDKNPKFDSENVIVNELDAWQFPDMESASLNFKRIYDELVSSPYVASVSFSSTVPGFYQENYNTFYPEGKSSADRIHLRKAYVGSDYFKTMGIDILNGSGFKKDTISYGNTVVLNQTAIQELGFDQAAGQMLFEGSTSGEPYSVIGVVDDFSYQGVQRKTQPLAHFFMERENLADWSFLVVKSRPGSSLQVIELLKTKWANMFSGLTPNYFFADDKLNEQYKEYIKINTLITWFSVLAIILSCIGLFALSSYAMARRTKEIGIRKVNGAQVFEILAMLNKDFLKWVLLAFLIAVPLSWYAMNKWLEGFAYKTTISWWIFAFAGFAALAIALLTVSWQSFRAAVANPVDTLRDE